MWNASSDGYINVIRFENLGFNTKPYNSTSRVYGYNAYCHCFAFINIEVTDILDCNLKLPLNIGRIEPPHNDIKWSGCFVFLENYEPDLIRELLFFKQNHKKNIALLDRNEKIWVRNINYKGQEIFKYFPVVLSDSKHYYTGLCSKNDWVLMSVDNALKRNEKAKDHYGYYPEEITEAYLMEKQVKDLSFFPSKNNYLSLGEIIKKWLIDVGRKKVKKFGKFE